jgi:hypothetical protein
MWLGNPENPDVSDMRTFPKSAQNLSILDREKRLAESTRLLSNYSPHDHELMESCRTNSTE